MKRAVLVVLVVSAVVASNAQPAPLSPVPPIPGVLISPDPGMPPPVLDVPGDPAIGPTAPEVDPRLIEEMAIVYEAWRESDGKDFQPGLSYANGHPILMLITESGEPSQKAGRRKRAILVASDALLKDGRFVEATICVVETSGKAALPVSAANYRLRRQDFHSTIKGRAQAESVTGAMQKIRGDDSLVQRICADLGIK